ncbi:MAG TPA: hypothetical protein VFN77_09640 [Acetobacteraceae bacterium]|nr:hypothetical protein [Acetobacteraceae bacterium]
MSRNENSAFAMRHSSAGPAETPVPYCAFADSDISAGCSACEENRQPAGTAGILEEFFICCLLSSGIINQRLKARQGTK